MAGSSQMATWPLSCSTFCVFMALLLTPFCRAGVPIHSVVPVECGHYFTWQSLGIFYSHRKVGQAGKITRVACCNDQEKEQYRDILHIVPTHVAPSYTVHPRTGDVYSAYNKPLAVLDFLKNNKVEEEYILVIDADMIFAQRFRPVDMGVRPGWAVSAFFSYMKGVNNELALKHVPEVLPRNDTLAGPMGRRGDMCGGFTFMMRDDLARVAPLWLKYTEDVRFDEDAWRLSGDQYAIHPGDKPWISEMYGYAYGAAKADVWHIAARTAMEYPEYELIEPPMVMHYGLEFNIPNTGFSFDKHWYYGFDALKCPPWNLDPKVRSMGGLFNHPPMPSELKTKGLALMRDLYAIMTVNTLNEAFCERHYLKCPITDELEKECAKVHMISEQVGQGLAYLEKAGVGGCEDSDPRCDMWAKAGECDNNPYYMAGTCRKSCHHCNSRPINAHLDDFSHAAWEQRFMKNDEQEKPKVQPATPIGQDTAQQQPADTTQEAKPADEQAAANEGARDAQQGDKVNSVKQAVSELLVKDTDSAAQQQQQQKQQEAETQQKQQNEQKADADADGQTDDGDNDSDANQKDAAQQGNAQIEKQPGHVPAKEAENAEHGAESDELGADGGVKTGAESAKKDEVVADEVPKQEKVQHEAPPLKPDGEQTDRRTEARKALAVEKARKLDPAAQQLVAKCETQKSVLSALQMQDCMDAAHKGVEYQRPTPTTPSSTVEHTINAIHDTDPAITHKMGLVQHAAGGVGFMIWCGIGLLIFMLQPKVAAKFLGRKRSTPAAARRLPL